jgi:hypothetical protein
VRPIHHLRRNAVAYVALSVALGGTSYAAVKLPKNSVGASQIKTNAVTSSEVKNGSLLAKDFKSGQLPKGAKGDKGDTGAKGATGAQGIQGIPGPDLERVAAQRDGAGGGTNLTAAGQTQVNSVTINAPTAGTLLISGHAFVNNNGAAGSYTLVAKLDGTATNGSGWNAAFNAAASGAGPAENFELSYTTPVQVAAGDHTVAQTLGPFSGTSDFFYNNQELSVVFIPGGTFATPST